jgi:hypothetical protein
LNITIFLAKLKYYFSKIIGDLKNGFYDATNNEQNMYLAFILILVGVFGLVLFED